MLRAGALALGTLLLIGLPGYHPEPVIGRVVPVHPGESPVLTAPALAFHLRDRDRAWTDDTRAT